MKYVNIGAMISGIYIVISDGEYKSEIFSKEKFLLLFKFW